MQVFKTCLVIGAFVIKTATYAQVDDSTLRKVDLQGAVNFRDIGGYKTNDGKTIKWGKIYRAAEINKLTNQDALALEKRKITTDIDFRGLEESKKAPDALWNKANYIRCGAGSETNQNWMQTLKSTVNGDSLMISYYQKIDSLGLRYKTLFNVLLSQNEKDAIVYHCTAGKDRTGIATALVLYSLGVPKQTIWNDYEASNYYRQSDNNRMIQMITAFGVSKNVAESMITVKPSYLEATWQAITKQYGSIDAFLEKELGIGKKEKEILRKKYIE